MHAGTTVLEQSPWLSIPASDYEAHMASPNVGQLQFLSGLFGDVLAQLRPRWLAVAGCATGNGFEHIDPDVTSRIVAIDINTEYLAILAARHSARLPGLVVVHADVAACDLGPGQFDLVQCALLFEYVRPDAVIPRLADWLRPGGVLSVVLQLPCHGESNVSDTTFASLKRLEPAMRLVAPAEVERAAGSAGMCEQRAWTQTLDSGKSFFVGLYAKPLSVGLGSKPGRHR